MQNFLLLLVFIIPAILRQTAGQGCSGPFPNPTDPTCYGDIIVGVDTTIYMGSTANITKLIDYTINTLMPYYYLSPDMIQLTPMGYGRNNFIVYEYSTDRMTLCNEFRTIEQTALFTNASIETPKRVLNFVSSSFGPAGAYPGRPGVPKIFILFTAMSNAADVQDAQSVISTFPFDLVIVTLTPETYNAWITLTYPPGAVVYSATVDTLTNTDTPQASCRYHQTLPPTTPVPATARPTDGSGNLALERSCACTTELAWLDIALVIDVSSNMGEKLGDAVTFLGSVLSTFTVSQVQPHELHVGIVTYSQDAMVVADLCSYTSYSDLINGLFSLAPNADGVVDLRKALNAAMPMLSNSRCARPNTRKVMVVIASDYKPNGEQDAEQVASNFRNSGGFVITVAYSQTKSLDDLEKLASPGMALDNRNQTTLYSGFKQSLCFANCFCKPLDSQFIYPINGYPTYFAECLKPVTIPAIGLLAERNCQNQHASFLPQIYSLAKSQFLKNVSLQVGLSNRFWIGLKCSSVSTCAWDGGNFTVSPNDVGFSDWIAGNPSTVGECIAMGPRGGFGLGWQSAPCSDPQNFLLNYFCQYNACDTDNYCA